jgi:hypothetical protein
MRSSAPPRVFSLGKAGLAPLRVFVTLTRCRGRRYSWHIKTPYCGGNYGQAPRCGRTDQGSCLVFTRGLPSQHELARAYQANGQVKEVVVLFEQVVTIRRTALADDRPDPLPL